MSRPGRRPLDMTNGQVDMSHGAGGRAMAQLIEELFFDAFDSPALNREHDAALLRVMVGLLKDDTELFKQYSDNEGFKRWLADTVFGLTFEEDAA